MMRVLVHGHHLGGTMRTTVNLDEELLVEAQRLTGSKERTALIHDGLRADRTGERATAGAVGRQRARFAASAAPAKCERMILVGTSLWVDHLRSSHRGLIRQLEVGQVCCHPLIIGEIACGNLRHRTETLALMRQLPGVALATEQEALELIDRRGLTGREIGCSRSTPAGVNHPHPVCADMDWGSPARRRRGGLGHRLFVARLTAPSNSS